MSAGYQPVLWNRFKKQYDLALWGGILLFLIVFITANFYFFPWHNIMTILIRGFGLLAIILLHVVLLIGPAARLSPKFLPVLYNRRHLGVTTFLMAAAHGTLSLNWFHGGGNVDPLVSLFTSNTHYNSIPFFPFQPLGFIALVILAIMAFTSHDFWLHFLSPRFWKAMHMLVYLAYTLVILHVALGILQFENNPVLYFLLVAGVLTISTLHVIAARKEWKKDLEKKQLSVDNWLYACPLEVIEEHRAKIVVVNQERVAIFKYEGKLSAVHNVCKHQLGPLGEGKIVDGCITCPWHGYQYKPEDGCAPPPFTEKVHTYHLNIIGESVYIQALPEPEGTFVEPVRIPEKKDTVQENPFFIGWSNLNIRTVFTLSRKFLFLSIPGLLALALVITAKQQKISSYKIEYGEIKEMKGWLNRYPVPTLTIVDGKDEFGNPQLKSILLVDALKKGAAESVSTVLGEQESAFVILKGYASYKYAACGPSDSTHDCIQTCTECLIGTSQFPLIELANGAFSFTEISPTFENLSLSSSGLKDTVVQGEIIDPKCYFGAMNPGSGKPHLSCATRCISGGIMPVLKYTFNQEERFAILLNANGKPVNQTAARYTAMPLTIKGKWGKFNNWEIIYLDEIRPLK